MRRRARGGDVAAAVPVRPRRACRGRWRQSRRLCIPDVAAGCHGRYSSRTRVFPVLEAWARRRPSVTIHIRSACPTTRAATVLRVPIDAAGVSTTRRHRWNYIRSRSCVSEKCVLHRLDGFGWGDVRFVKIDVEGHEFDVLRGAAAMLTPGQKPALLVESNNATCSGRFRRVPVLIATPATGMVPRRARCGASMRSTPARRGTKPRLATSGGVINNFLFLAPGA